MLRTIIASGMILQTDKILDIASHVSEPIPALVFTVATLFLLLLNNRWLKLGASATTRRMAYGIIFLGFAPLVLYAVSAYRGVYRVQVTVLDLDKRPIHDAEVSAAIGQKKQTDIGWEFDIYPQDRQAGSVVTFYASAKDRYLEGHRSLNLGANFSPDVAIELAPLQQADVLGAVQTRDGKAVAGASVSVIGYSDQATTDSMGDFKLPSHAANGQMVTVRIQKGNLHGQFTIPAGKASSLTISR
jgi:hypothetical protein